jgi:ferredoxin
MLTLYAQIHQAVEFSMKVIVDFDACAAHGDCVVAAPEIFDLGEDDETVTLLDPEPPEDLRPQAQAAVDACPMAAIRIED